MPTLLSPSPDDPPPPARAETASSDLLAGARAGDRGALERLVARWLPRLRRWAHGRLPPAARERYDTDDLVQDALIRTAPHVTAFEPPAPGALPSYLRQTVRNAVRDEIRRAAVRPQTRALSGHEPAAAASPLQRVLDQEEQARYEAALARLDEDDRRAIVLRLLGGGSYADLARGLGKPSADAARMAVSRAVLRLAREMARG